MMKPADDEHCKSCLFWDLCAGIDLPHCGGDDYVKFRGDRNERDVQS